VVAHPDDCVIFAYSFIHNHPAVDWTILYLTYTHWDYRGSELCAFWNQRNIHTVFLGYVDDWHDIENKKISFDTDQAQREIQGIIKDFDLVLTHNSQGEYGHLHHVFVHNCVRDHAGLVTFADLSTGTVTYTVPPGTYTWDELPQHQGVVRAFFPETQHQNNYNEVAK
jgi:LmbE family N-acetylglucosaminyl deacetylase